MDFSGALSLAELIDELDGVEGRKRLQKIVYLLQAKGHPDFRQSFVLYIFGPFSRNVAAQLDFVHDAGLVDEKEVDGTYQYSVSPEQKSRVSGLIGNRSKAGEWRGLAARLDGNPTHFLEALSTLVFLNKTRELVGVELKREFDSVKPHLSGQFEPALEFARTEYAVAESASAPPPR